MSTVTMNISLTDELKAFVESRIKARGYSSTSEYVRELVRRDEELAKEERFRALIQEGLNSPLLPESFDLRSHMLAKMEARRQAPRA